MLTIKDLTTVKNTEFIKHPNLEHLIIMNCDNIEDNTFYGCPNLRTLCFKNCKSINKNCIKMLKKLKVLYIIDCDNVQNEILTQYIETLVLVNTNRIDDFAFKYGYNINHLTIQGNTSITGDGFVFLSNLYSMTLIDVPHIKLQCFIYLAHIDLLILSYMNIPEQALTPLTNLTYLAVDNVYNFKGTIISHFKKLKQIYVVECHNVSYTLLRNNPAITKYNIEKCKSINKKKKMTLHILGLCRKIRKKVECMN